jgi:hypothetical protein
MKLGRKTSKRCKWCRDWQVYTCGYAPHRGIGGRLSCSQCHNHDVVCASSKHPRNKPVYDC